MAAITKADKCVLKLAETKALEVEAVVVHQEVVMAKAEAVVEVMAEVVVETAEDVEGKEAAAMVETVEVIEVEVMVEVAEKPREVADAEISNYLKLIF